MPKDQLYAHTISFSEQKLKISSMSL